MAAGLEKTKRTTQGLDAGGTWGTSVEAALTGGSAGVIGGLIEASCTEHRTGDSRNLGKV